MAVTDVILEHHIDPPTRQQMILDAIKGLYAAAGMRTPGGMSSRVSALTSHEQLSALLAETSQLSHLQGLSNEALQQSLFDCLTQSVPGDAELVSAMIARSTSKSKGTAMWEFTSRWGWMPRKSGPQSCRSSRGGPAYKTGIKEGDIIEQIDGFDTKDKGIRDAVDRIRGDEGTLVMIQVRQPQETKSRTYKVPPGALPRSTVQGFRKATPDGWDFRIDGLNPIGYLHIKEISASTAHELRKLAGQLESEGFRRLYLTCAGLGAIRFIRRSWWRTACWREARSGRSGTARGEDCLRG